MSVKPLLVAGALLALLCAAPLRADEDLSAQPFFAAKLADADSKPMALGALRGQPVVVNFWASWCTPCRAEIPALVDAYEEGKARGLVVLGVAVDDDAAGVRAFAAAHDMSYPVVAGKDQALALMRTLGNDRMAVPFTVAIDRNGRVVAKRFGILRPGELDGMVAALLRPARQPG